MNYSILGKTDLQVPRIGLGTVEIGLPYGVGLPNPPPDNECIELLRFALDQGITYFDTAAGYGRSEELLGKAFGKIGDARPIIATKVSMQPSRKKPHLVGKNLIKHINNSIDESLRRLQTPSLDLVQVYVDQTTFTSGSAPDSLITEMDKLITSGKVRWWGATSYGAKDALSVIQQGIPFRTLQVAYNLLDRTLEDSILPKCRQNDIGIVIRSVFLQGILSHRMESYPKRLEVLKRTARQAQEICEEHGIALPEAALRFAIFGPAKANIILVGTFSKKELTDNIRAESLGPLPSTLSQRLDPLSMNGSELVLPQTWKLPDRFN